MKKVLLFALFALAIIGMATSCGGKKADKTIENLKTAFNGESTAAAKYAKYAEKAVAEGYDTIAKFFSAAAMSEGIHAANHAKALAKLGVADVQAVIGEIVVDSTAANLADAIKGEAYEFEVMYPGFLTIANEEGCNEAITTFTYATEAEKKHNGYFQNALDNMGNESVLTESFFVCPVCGNTYYGTPVEESCELCMAPSSSYMAVN